MGTIKNLIGFSRVFKNSKKKDIFKDNHSSKLIHNQDILDINIRTVRNTSNKFNSLIFKDKFSTENGFRLIYSKGFNSFGFKEKVDLVFCDVKNQVIETYSNFSPNKMTKYYDKVNSIYVLANNMNKYLNIKQNDLLKILK
ncbi:hypothetical protein [Spiroplasma diminutum]|uniref:Uncharacterized protein n=1 Tax=Spiroplasma diminutum CUAS-1 TaxID=1276221 RepID=S5ME74_9MOLU|nr:hypothetical protein [Spiroplasma diminutum]AGR42028.1 hypothetical protein SDIMI_v3c03240 [Spiroplasma diminutum CUAS-1]